MPTRFPLPTGYFARTATLDDAEAVARLKNIFSRSVTGEDERSAGRILAEWEDPRYDLARSVLLVESLDGELVGEVSVLDTDEVPVDPWVLGSVHPDHVNRGIGSHLLEWSEARAREAIDRVPVEFRVSMRVGIHQGHGPSRMLLEDCGFQVIRHFWRMVIDLDGIPKDPRWPEGIELRPYRPDQDAEAVYRAEDEAFRDHWGHVEESFEYGFENWLHWNTHPSGYEPTLWFIAWDGDQIAGSARCRPEADHDPEMGWVRTLSVRKPYRRRGLALALLQHSFGALYGLGKLRAGLGVDSENTTGATRLYEKAGMRVQMQFVSYEKELRPGVDLLHRE